MTQGSKGARPVQLHVIHDLGGGSVKWLRDFVRADPERANLVLRSFTHDSSAGCGIALFAGDDEEQPLAAWTFREPIIATAVTHPEYRAALEQIVRERRVDVVVVSSLIGHSLEVLDTGLSTLVVNHDYYPYCPAINIHFDGLCRECDDRRIARCYSDNPRFNPFVDFVPADRIAVRRRFLELVARPKTTMVVPSHSVQENLTRLEPRFSAVRFATIPHGYGEPLVREAAPEPAADDRMRVMVFGQLSEAKGLEILQAALPELTRFAEVYLVGAREVGELFQFKPHIHVTGTFEFAELPKHVANINPHLAVVASIVPETFSYALSELWMLGVPVAATRVGAFAERIREGETGFLFEPDAKSLVRTVETIDLDRSKLAPVRERLRDWKPATAPRKWCEAYHQAAPVAGSRAISAGSGQGAPPRRQCHARGSPGGAGRHRRRECGSRFAARTCRWRSSTKRGCATRWPWVTWSARHARDRKNLEAALAEMAASCAVQGGALVVEGPADRQDGDRDRAPRRRAGGKAPAAGGALRIHQLARDAPAARPSSRLLRQLRTGLRLGLWALAHPMAWRGAGRKVRQAWSQGGWRETKKALLGLPQGPSGVGHHDLWSEYRRRFEFEVKPRIVEAIARRQFRPLISVVVPVYNTREEVLRQMLESVRAQLYTDWELCIADDASTEPHVRRILERYAAEDARINVHLLRGESRGRPRLQPRASSAPPATSSCCWTMTTCWKSTRSSAWPRRGLTTTATSSTPTRCWYARRRTVRHYSYRPAFSLGVPALAPLHRPPGGASARRCCGRSAASTRPLAISQDYDLILRAAEKAKTIVHIPDILYRWRIHGSSSGYDARQQVMEVSRGVVAAPPGALRHRGRGPRGRALQPLRAALRAAFGPQGRHHHPDQEPRRAAAPVHREPAPDHRAGDLRHRGRRPRVRRPRRRASTCSRSSRPPACCATTGDVQLLGDQQLRRGAARGLLALPLLQQRHRGDGARLARADARAGPAARRRHRGSAAVLPRPHSSATRRRLRGPATARPSTTASGCISPMRACSPSCCASTARSRPSPRRAC